MKLIFTVKSITQVNDGKMLVQLAGKHGHVALDLPLGHKITVGDEFVLEADVVSLIPIEEVAQRRVPKIMAPAVPSGVPTYAPTSGPMPGLKPPSKFKL
jgi:hypothetical protein